MKSHGSGPFSPPFKSTDLWCEDCRRDGKLGGEFIFHNCHACRPGRSLVCANCGRCKTCGYRPLEKSFVGAVKPLVFPMRSATGSASEEPTRLKHLISELDREPDVFSMPIGYEPCKACGTMVNFIDNDWVCPRCGFSGQVGSGGPPIGVTILFIVLGVVAITFVLLSSD